MTSSPVPPVVSTGRDAAVAGGEGLEELSKEFGPIIAAVHAEGLSGMPAAIEIASRIDWARIAAKTGAHFTARKIAEALTNGGGFTDPATKFATILVIENVIAGAAVSGIDQIGKTLGDRTKLRGLVAAAVQKVVPTKVDPNGGIVALTYHSGEGSGYVHKARVDGSSNLVLFPGRGHANTVCNLMSRAIEMHDLAFPTHTSGGGKNKTGAPIPVTHHKGHEFRVDEPTDVLTAAATKKPPCPDCFPGMTFLAPAAPAKAATFFEKVRGNQDVVDVLGAIIRFVATHPRAHIKVDLMEDIQGHCDFAALVTICELIRPRLISVTDGATPPVHQYYGIEEAEVNEFFTFIDGFGGGELKAFNKADEAAHGVLENLKHAWEHRGEHGLLSSAFLNALTAVLATVVGYLFLAPLAILGIWGVGVFGPFDNPVWNLAGIGIGSIGLILWFVPWYSLPGVTTFFGGIFHPHVNDHGEPTIANTARNATALFLALGLVGVLVLDIESVVGIHMPAVRAFVVLGMSLALIAYDRVGAGAHGEEKIHHLLVDLKFGNIKVLSVVALVMAVSSLPMAYRIYVDQATVYRAAVVKTAEGVAYIPTPKGTVFKPEDILGATEAKAVVDGVASGEKKPICLSEGVDFDLPGYTEKVVKAPSIGWGLSAWLAADKPVGVPDPMACAVGTTGYAIRANLPGKRLAWERKATEYASVEALQAATLPSTTTETVTTTTDAPDAPKAETETSKPEAKTDAPAPTKAFTATATTAPAKRGVDCSTLSFRQRQQRGCK